MAIWYAIPFLVLGAVGGGLAGWLAMVRQMRAAHARDARLAQLVIKFSHDIRGAVTPALLMAERLEMNADPAVKQAAAVVASAMERTAEIAKAASAEARATGGVAKGERRGR
jgi:signal transduction histidine kinase